MSLFPNAIPSLPKSLHGLRPADASLFCLCVNTRNPSKPVKETGEPA